MLNKIKFFLAIGYTIVLTILSLISVSGIPEFGTDYDDKIYHLFAYFILTSVWYFAIGETFNKRQILYLTLSCIGFGIIIEAIQGKLTVNRAGDFFDIVANLVGVFSATIFILMRQRKLS